MALHQTSMIAQLFQRLGLPSWLRVLLTTTIALPTAAVLTMVTLVANFSVYGKLQAVWEPGHTVAERWNGLMEPAVQGWFAYAALGVLVFWGMFVWAVLRNPGWFRTFNPIANAWVMALPRMRNTRRDQAPRREPWWMVGCRAMFLVFYATNLVGIIASSLVVGALAIGLLSLAALVMSGVRLGQWCRAQKS